MPAPNTVPTINMQTFSGTENVDYVGTIVATDADGDTLTYSLVADGSQGSVTSLNASSGAFTYHPNANTHGADHFNISVNDGHGGVSTAVMTINVANVNSAPVAHDDRAQFATGATIDVNVLGNDTDADTDPLTVAIEEAALVGTATVQPDKKVRITGLPANFRGMTRFKYKVTDPDGETSIATAVVFVDTAPFAAVFGRDATGGGYEIAWTDFGSAAPRALNLQLTGGKALRSFVPSKNGNVVAFTRGDPADFSHTLEICVLATTAGATPTCFALPANTVPAADGNLPPMVSVSDDGHWVAIPVQRSDNALGQSLYVIDATAPLALQPVVLANSYTAIFPTFSVDSSFLYFGARDNTTYATLSQQVYRVALNALGSPTLLADEVASNDIEGYYVADNDDLIVIQRQTSGQYLKIEAATPTVEVALSSPAQSVFQVQGATGRIHGNIFPFGVAGATDSVWVADLIGAPNSRLLYTFPVNTLGLSTMSVREDDAAVLVTYVPIAPSPQVGPVYAKVYEQEVDSANPATLVGTGSAGYYAPGDRALVQGVVSYPGGSTFLSVAERATFGTTTSLTDNTTKFVHTTSALTDTVHGGVVYGLSSTNSASPASSQATYVNLAAPGAALTLGNVSTTRVGNLVGPRLWLVYQN